MTWEMIVADLSRDTVPAAPPVSFFMGVDLGQARDYTALAIVELVAPPRVDPALSAMTMAPDALHCRHLERLPLGTLYPAAVAHVQRLLRDPALAKVCALVVDATGVGRPVVDMMTGAGLELSAVSITGGDASSRGEDGIYRVPKRDLVSRLQVLLQTERIKFASGLPLVATLVAELMSFQVKISDNAHDSYGAWREGEHDDLVLALALACWLAERATPWLIG